MSQNQLAILKRALEREKLARKAAEKILEEKSRELFQTSQRLEYSLNEKSLQLEGIFENIIDAYAVIDINGNVIKFNEAATKLFGYNIDEESISVKDLIYKDDYKYAIASFSELLTKGVFKNYEARIYTKSKQVKWVHINASAVLNKNNKPIAAQGIVRDITKEKKAEEQLIESKNRLSTLVLNLDNGIILEDENRKIVLTNKKFCELFGIDAQPKDLIGMDCVDASEQNKVLFKNPEFFIQRIEKIARKREVVIGDELEMKSGKILERNYMPITIGEKSKGFLWTFTDVTLKRRYRESIEAEKQKYSGIIANMNLGLIEVNNDDEILMVNQSFSEMSGYSEEELIGKKGNEMFPIEDGADIILKEAKKRIKGKSSAYEIKVKTGNDKIRYWLISGAPSYNLQGEITGSIGVHLDITNLKTLQFQKEKLLQKLEYLLSEKASQLQGVFENIIDAYVVIDLNGNVLKLNEAATKLFGYNIEEESINVANLIYRDDYEYAMASFLELLKKGFFKNYEARAYTKSKQVKWVHINASVVLDKDNKAVAIQGIVRDITETRRNNEIIEEQKSQLDAIVQNSSIGIVLSTQQGNILRTNLSAQKSLGYSEEELSKLTIQDISFPEVFLQSKEYIKKMDAGQLDNFVIQKRYKKKNGSVFWSKTNISAVRDNGGNLKYQIALVEDITLDKEQSVVKDIYEIAREITDNIVEYLGTKDCVIYIIDEESQSLEQIAAYGAKLNDKNEIKNKIILPLGEGIVGSIAKSGKPEIINDTSKDFRYIVDDERRFSEITVPIIYDDKIIGVIDSEHISKNYFTKEHLRTLKNIANLVAMQLKSAINLRAFEKVEQKNRILLDALGKSNDELQEYAHIVSHDLKSPLRSIYALVSWLKEDNKGKLDDVSLQNFSLIETTLEKMEQLISDILEYSSIDANDNNKIDVDVHNLVEELIAILYVPKHIKITINQKLPILKGDKTKFQQLFQNLISNAVKFSDKPNGKIDINVKSLPNHYEFSISDNGIGIEEKFHNKIFKIFHSLNKSKNSTGIGLSIVKKIVNLYKGDVWLESTPNQGTTFFFTLKK